MPFSLVWCGLVVYWTISALKASHGWFFAAWGMLLVALGLYMVVGRLIVRQVKLRKVVYTVTNLRVIIRSSARQEESRYLGQLPPPTVTESSDGSGTIRFGSTSLFHSLRSRRGTAWEDQFVLYAIPQARRVRDLILTATTR